MHYFSNKLKKNKNKLFFVTPKKEKLSYQEFNQKSVILASYLYSKNGSLKNLSRPENLLSIKEKFMTN